MLWGSRELIQRRATRPYATGAAFTLVEIVLAVGIIGVLACLALAAIQGTRESARRSQCANNLRQLGIGLATTASFGGAYPSPLPSRDGRFSASVFEISGIYELLPAIDQLTVYNALNIGRSRGIHDPANTTGVQTRLSVLVCPSDSLGYNGAKSAPLNYRFNVAAPRPGLALRDTSLAGAFTPLRPSLPSAFLDGMSTTIGLSERVVGGMSERSFDRYRDFWYAGAGGLVKAESADEVATVCSLQNDGSTEFSPDLGKLWAGNTFLNTWYNHVMGPNSRASDCAATSDAPGPANVGYSAVSARSWHPSVVTSLFMDGSVRAVSASIELRVWRALATRSGGEVLTGGTY